MSLVANDLVVRYGSVAANKGVSVSVEPGETIALLGPNGAGKTTFLSALAGLVAVESGQIEYRGTSLLGMKPEQIVSRGLALVPENRHIFGALTVRENLIVGASTVSAEEESGNLDRVLERFPILLERNNQKAGLLSGGEQQQLAIARALMSSPNVLLLDEPSLGLAPKLVDLIFEVVASLKADGVTILLVEQNARKAIGLADRVYVLRNGRISADMTGAEAMADRDSIEREYFGEGRAS